MKKQLTEAQEQARGELIAAMLNLKEAKSGDHPRNLKSYDPPRYYTQWGTKSALGLFRSVKHIIETGE